VPDLAIEDVKDDDNAMWAFIIVVQIVSSMCKRYSFLWAERVQIWWVDEYSWWLFCWFPRWP